MISYGTPFSGFSVADVTISRDFYRDVLGLTVFEPAPDMVGIELGQGHSVLAYPKGEGHVPANFTVLNLPVADVSSAVRELSALGVEFIRYDGMPQDEDGVMKGHGPDIAWFTDPSGNVFSIIAAPSEGSGVSATNYGISMASVNNRNKTALIVIDLQVGVVDGAHDREAVIGRVAELVTRARSSDVPVVWVQHSDDGLEQGSEEWQYVPELTRLEGESLVHKSYGDSFEGTDLEALLSQAGIRHLIVAGAETDACIRSTIHGAFARDYDVTLVGDAHTTTSKAEWGAPPPEQVIAHTNLYWKYQSAPGRSADVIDSGDVSFERADSEITAKSK